MCNSMSDLLICSIKPVREVDSPIISSKGFQYYYRIWKYITHHDALWYDIRLPEDDLGGSSIINDYDDDLYRIHQPVFFLAEKYNCVTKFKINSAYFDTLTECLREILLSSGIKTAFFLVRYQSYDIELVQGVYSFTEFKEKLWNNELFSNVCYIITFNGEESNE